MIRDGKPEGFFYLDHRTVDLKYNLITDVHVTPGNVHDSVPYLSRLDRQRERFGFEVEAVALDSGYLTTPICQGLEERKIFAVIAHRRFHPTQGLFPKWKFKYDAERNVYICPAQQELPYRTTDRKGYRQYASDPKHVPACPCWSNVPSLETTESGDPACLGRQQGVGAKKPAKPSPGNSCTENEKRRLSEASRMPKSSMGFAIAVCADFERQGTSADDGSRAEHEEDGDPPGSAGKEGEPSFLGFLACKSKKEKPNV